MRKWTNYIVIIALILGGAGWLIMQRQSANIPASDQQTETATVQRGDLAVSIDATGNLVSPAEFTLAFSTAGKVSEILVAEGQTVKNGDLLARLEDNLQAEADFQALFTDAGIAKAELAAINAREALGYAIDDLVSLIGVDAYRWEGQLKQAEETLATLNQDPKATVEQKAEAQKAVDEARGWRDYFRELHIKELESVRHKEYFVPQIPPGGQMPPGGQIPPNPGGVPRKKPYTIVYVKVSDADLGLVYANWENAKVTLEDAEAALEIVKSGPSALQSPLIALGSEMARLEQTRQKVENTRLTAPADGMVTKSNFQVGEYARPGAPVIVVSSLTALDAEVNLDETDVSRIQTGMKVIVSVDAFTGQQLNGQVTEIALSANIQSGVVLYPVTVRVNAGSLPLRSGLTVSVTFPIEQRSDTLLVPFRAVETEGGQAYVTQVTASGSERVAVTLGLITDTQVEILSGLQEGQVVTVYANPVQDTELMSNPMFGGGQ